MVGQQKHCGSVACVTFYTHCGKPVKCFCTPTFLTPLNIGTSVISLCQHQYIICSVAQITFGVMALLGSQPLVIRKPEAEIDPHPLQAMAEGIRQKAFLVSG